MKFPQLVFLIITVAVPTVNSNIEGDILHAWRTSLNDPDEALSSWDPSLINPCTWAHVTCSNDNTVIRLDLEDAELSGPLIPSLAKLANLQYLEIAGNNITGEIPRQMGKLKNIISLRLNQNHLSGSIPSSLGKLRSLRFLRLDGNHLSGAIPIQVIQLIQGSNLQILNVSNNHMAGTTSNTGGNDGYATTTIVQDLRATK